MELREKLRILGLSAKEEKVLLAVMEGIKTPLLIAERTKVTRPAVYEILKRLKTRGIAHTRIINGKRYWELQKEMAIDESLYEAKKVLLSITEGAEEVRGMSDGTIIVHRGKEAVRDLITTMLKGHKRDWFYTMQGDAVQKGWDDVIGQEKIKEFNEFLRKNEIISKMVLPDGWFEDQVRRLGNKEGAAWVKGFMRRPHSAVRIDKSYFDHAGQIFIFKNSLYLISMNEALVVEIRNSELQKLIKQMFAFIEDNGQKFNMSEHAELIIKDLEGKAANR